MPNTSSVAPVRGRDRHRGRLRRLSRRLLTVLVVALAAVTVVGWFTSGPPVGHWTSADGRQAYVAAYDRTMAGITTPTETRDVPTRYGTVHVHRWASGDPDADERPSVVLLPGVMSGSPMWAEQVGEITRHRHVYAMDAIGDAGLSAQTAPLTSYEDQANWVEDCLGGLDLDRVHTVGHSFGGATATIHAQRYPHRVADLTVLEPAFTLVYPPPATFVWATVATLPVPQRWRDRALAEIGGVPVEEVRSDDAVGRMIALAAEHYSPGWPTPVPRDEDDLRSLAMPVYVAIASDASLAGGARAVERAHLIPHATVETWPDTTHSLPMQAGAELTDRLHSWWTQNETRG